MTEQMVDRPLRSVFVGNIPYEVTEEELKDIFSEVGPVLSLKLVYDRDTGKPKGYGFCEYKDIETAMSAMRHLNGTEIKGRTLRVDNAGAERHRLEMGNANVGNSNGPDGYGRPGGMGGGGGGEMQHMRGGGGMDEGPPPPEKAPEVISKAVASLPPEQMFEIMKQMKACIQNNPAEARTMLLQNPQLSYALLQALVVMKIVDPPTAIGMLHKDNSMGMGSLLPEGMGGSFAPPPSENPWIAAAGGGVPTPLMQVNPGPGFAQGMGQGVMGGDLDLRTIDPRLRNQGPSDFDLRDPRGQQDPRFQMDRQRDRDLRDRDMRADRDLRDGERGRDPRAGRDRDRDQDLRAAPLDPRARGRGAGGPTSSDAAAAAASKAAAAFTANLPGASDKEKADLIMQVLQLTDDQIGQLPEAQRNSILVLKEQIAKTQRR